MSRKVIESDNTHQWLVPNKKRGRPGVPVVAQWLTNPTRNHEVAGSVPALAQWVNNELWCRLQTRLGSHVAVALS